MAVAPTLYGASLIGKACVTARVSPFYVRADSSEWGLLGRFTRSAIRGTPSPFEGGEELYAE